MKKFKKLLGFTLVFMVVMVAFCSVSFAATVGQELTSPESGWQRINDSSSFIEYTNFNNKHTSKSYGNYNNDLSYSGLNNAKVNFSFYGTKLRVIGQRNTSEYRTVDGLIITIDGIQYYYNEIGSVQLMSLEYEITGLTYGKHNVIIERKTQDYKYITLDAIDIDSTGYLVDSNFPTAPTNLTATPGNAKVDLSWSAVDGETSYNIKRANTAGGPYTTIATSSAITFTDSTVTSGTTYYYVVTAVNASGESPNSNEASATIVLPINQLKLVLEVNEEKQLSVSDELGDNIETDWTSFDSAIAPVDANGKVKALKPGNTVITCTSEDKSYTESINVLVVDLEYQLAVDLNVGGTCRLTIDDMANTTNVTWSSYDSAIATVSAKGKVTAISEGLTYVVANDKDGKEMGRIYIRVRQ